MMLRGQVGGVGGGGSGGRCLFTASQWQELEHQALIFKYMAAGSQVPHELVLPLRDRDGGGFAVDTVPSLAFPPPLQTSRWGCYGVAAAQYGRKAEDPEPGRCRRTDGKKWRCSREAYGESKYCDKHIHRGKNRSRKPVEATASAAASGGGDGASYRPSALSISPPTPDAPSSYAYGYHHLRPDASSARGAAAPLQLHFDTAAAASPPPSYHRYAQPQQYCNTSSLFPSGYGSSREAEARQRQQHCLALGADLSLDKPDLAASSSSSKKTEEKPLRRFFVDDWPRESSDGRAPWMMDHQLRQDETQLSISISTAPPDLAIAAASRHHHHHGSTPSTPKTAF